MLFNSLAFALFLPVVFAVYWLIPRHARNGRNAFLIVASYVFYGWWDWRFLFLIVLSSAVDFLVGRALGVAGSRRRRRQLLGISLAVNLGTLGFFKYFNFFVDSFASLLAGVGYSADLWTLSIILPVGISFYTFQTLSYTIDIYRRRLEPTDDVLAFFAFVAFFPQLVAGPIERAGSLLPQFHRESTFDHRDAAAGLRQGLWGLFKKTVIADNLAPMVDAIWSDPASQSSFGLALGAVYFGIQIYADFSGYSDIAIGTARLFGFDLQANFRYPYFSRNVREFWGRWHISLSSWFRDYVYIPLGGSRSSRGRQLVNILITFAVSGLWHGASWTFVIWGLLHAALYAPVVFARRSYNKGRTIVAAGRIIPNVTDAIRVASTFAAVTFAWIFFRSESLDHALAFIGAILSADMTGASVLTGLGYVVVISVIEWVQRERVHGLDIAHLPRWMRWVAYYAVLAAVIYLGAIDYVPFIYFQF